ncbi:cytochrome c oxidase assembly protein [Peribacillus simplex]|uniref:cytochrome c oxidase assembly protein n=1 Tax=Peribacillus simplex TaxID=1478 RepID=UPI0014857119|nr:cytochrome c oxidase assembly protein [Peribacillus simplex]
MNHNNHSNSVGTNLNQVTEIAPQLLLALPFILALILYIFAVIISNRHHKQWPLSRTVYWVSGVLSAVISVAGPLANRAHIDFTAHMLSHLLLGMLAPLLMVLAAPMTLVLRTIRITLARRLTRVLRSWLSRMFTHPIVTSVLNIGGLWLLYTTNLYSLMHESTVLNFIVHFHVFMAGYLFTVSMIYIDPILHRISFLYRSIVLIIALAGHGILSKYIYTHPPAGIPLEQANQGSMIMYYGGDIIDIIIIFILCLQWFRATKPRRGLALGQAIEQR